MYKVIAVEQSMQCCEKLLQDSFETYKTFLRSVNPEFERKFEPVEKIKTYYRK